MGMKICITTDDFRPSLIPLWEETWDKLKEKHQGLKVTVFCSVHNKEFGENEQDYIPNSEPFREWFEKRKDWVEIQPHGFDHTEPPENLRSEDEQEQVVRKTIFALRDYLNMDYLVWKAPFYRTDKNTIPVLVRCNIKAHSQWWDLHLLFPQKRRLPYYIDLGTHTSLAEGNNPDNIDKIYQELDDKLDGFEEEGRAYSTLGEILKEVIV